MRLINVHTLEISTFADSEVPLYAALSHRWGRDEVEYHEFTDASARNKAGFAKIQNVCREVRDWSWSFKRRPPHGHTEQHRCERVHWVWIDTCCIDKRNFTEYAEAITSMWAWYKSAAFCIVYLRDVKQYKLRRDTLTAVRDSEWFERGWTLQELLAPRTLFFYSNNWKQVGSSAESDLMETISRASGIPARCMGNRGVKMKDISVAKRMSWASGRKTTKPEDLACCLLGMFEVYMPLMYGEGFRVAFQRLQRTIIECYDDESIFAFTPQSGQDGVLATNLRDFANCGNVIKCTRQQRLAYSISNRGLQFNATAIDVGSTIGSRRPRRRYAIDLNCAKQVSGDTKPVMCTLGLKRKGSRFIRDPEIERVFEAVSKAGVERRLNRGTWEWIPSQWFYIHVSKSGRSRRQREIVEEPDTVSGIFSKAIDWLSSHYPLEAFGLRPRPLDRNIRETRSKLEKRGRSRRVSRSANDRKNYSQPSASRRSYRHDSRSREKSHSRPGQRHSREASRAPRHPEPIHGESIGRQLLLPWSTDTSSGLLEFLAKDQCRDDSSMCPTCGRPWRNAVRDREERLHGRPSRSRIRSSKPARRGDSGYHSTHSRHDARDVLAYNAFDSGLSS